MKLKRILPGLALVCVLPFGALVFAAQAGTAVVGATNAPDDRVGPIDIPGGDLDTILGVLERLTGRTLLRPQNLPAASLTLKLDEKVTKGEAIQAVETLLNLNGIAVTPMGDRFLKVTALSAAKSEAPELIESSTLNLPPSGRIASKLFQLNFLRVGEFMPQIQPLLNPAAGSPPIVFDKANAALITDSISNLQRIETLVQRLDQPVLSGLAPKFYTLQSAKASEVVNKMRTMLSGPLQNQLGATTTFNADDRTNQIVLIADPRQYAFFDQLIARLDVRADPNTRNEVIYLKHAAAKDVASLLSDLVKGQNNATKTTGLEVTRTNTPGAQPAAQPAPNAPPAVTATVTAGAFAADSTNQFSSVLTVLPEERSNAIVVSGTVDDLRLIRDLVSRIDVLLSQVRIEVVIAEVTLDDNKTSGISQLGLVIRGDRLVGFSGSAAGIGVTNGTITTNPNTGNLDLAAEISLGTTPRKNNANILSVPNIITTHNKEASIFVGENRPVISSYLNDSTTTNTTGTGYRSTINQQQVGITLKVKPLIGADGSVQLDIDQEVSDVIGNTTIDNNSQPIVGERKMESFVSAKSGDIVVLGGLQTSKQTHNTNRLGPIPIIGDLFGSRSREDIRTDLVFFLRPTVLTNTPLDNQPALNQIEQFPDPQRGRVKRALNGETLEPADARRK